MTIRSVLKKNPTVGGSSTSRPTKKRKEDTLASEIARIRKEKSKTTSWTTFEKQALERIQSIALSNTIFPYERIVDDMGLSEFMTKALRRIGIGQAFMSIRSLTHPSATRQFLATLKVDYPDKNMPSNGLISFKIQDRRYEISTERLCEIFGFKNTPFHTTKRLTPPKDIWATMSSDKEYKGKFARHGKIKHPGFRYLARLLQEVIFARHDKCRVTQNEITVLSYTLEKDKYLEKHNLGCLMLDHWEKTANECKNEKLKTSVCFGGLVSYFLSKVGVDLSWDAPMTNDFALMDRDYLVRNHLVVECLTNNKYIYGFTNDENEELRVYLPMDDFKDVDNRSLRFKVPKKYHVSIPTNQGFTMEDMDQNITRMTEFLDYNPPSFDDYEVEMGGEISHEERLNLYETALRESYSTHNTAVKAFKSMMKPFIVMYKTLKTCGATKDVMQSVIDGATQPTQPIQEESEEEEEDEEEEEEDESDDEEEEEEAQNRFQIKMHDKAQGKRPMK